MASPNIPDLSNVFAKALEKISPVLGALSGKFITTVESLNSSIQKLLPNFRLMDQAIGSIQYRIGRFVELSNPATMVMFNMALRDFQATIGQALNPLMKELTKTFRFLGDTIISLTPEGKTLIATLVATSVIIPIVTAGMLGLKLVLTTLLSPFSAITTIIGILTASFLRTEAGGRMLSLMAERLSLALPRISQALEPLIAKFGEFMIAIGPAMLGALDLVIGGLTYFVEALSWIARQVGNLTELMAGGIRRDTLVEALEMAEKAEQANPSQATSDKVKQIRDMLKKYDEQSPADAFKPGRSGVGAAVVPFQSGSAEDIGVKNRLAAFGQGMSQETQELKQANQKLDTLIQAVMGASSATTQQSKSLDTKLSNVFGAIVGAGV